MAPTESMTRCRYRWLRRVVPLVVFLGLTLRPITGFAEGYVLLSNGNVLSGQALLIGPVVIVQRSDGSELKINAQQFVHAAATIEELYAVRLQRNPPNVFADHLENARWCLRHQLVSQMEQALLAATALDPTHPDLVYLQRQWKSQQMLQQVSREGGNLSDVTHALGYASATADLAPMVQIQRANPETVDPDELAKHNLTPHALNAFVNSVQPLLVSRCGNAGCHRSPSEETTWELTHMGTHRRPSPRMTQLNVVRVLEQIDLADAAASRLLLYAGKIHGGKDGDEYRPTDQRVQQALEHWIALLQYDQSQPSLNHRMNEIMRESPQGGEPGPIRRLGVTGGAGGGGVQAVGYWEDTVAPEIPTATTIPTVDTLLKPPDAASPGQPGRPMRLPSVSNPVDPAIFNRLYRDTSGAK